MQRAYRYSHRPYRRGHCDGNGRMAVARDEIFSLPHFLREARIK
jgi:hypothetical protein